MIPASTCRLQVTADQDLHAVRRLVPYLHRLGVEALYLSPLFHARTGSSHGYDAVDPNRISEELGGRAALERLAETLREHRMGLLLDVVPNHLAATPENPWWRDVLEHGSASRFAPVFDIDWRRPEPPAEGKVVLPILGERYGEVLEAGELTVGWTDDGLGVSYFETTLPLDPATYPLVLDDAVDGEPDGESDGEPGAEGGVDDGVEDRAARRAAEAREAATGEDAAPGGDAGGGSATGGSATDVEPVEDGNARGGSATDVEPAEDGNARGGPATGSEPAAGEIAVAGEPGDPIGGVAGEPGDAAGGAAGEPGDAIGGAAGGGRESAGRSGGAATAAGSLARLSEAFAALPRRDDSEPGARERRLNDAKRLKEELRRLCAEDEDARRRVDEALARLNAPPSGAPRHRLDALLSGQAWWLAFWRTEAEAVNYRRFFNISHLVGVRVEEPDVFRETHRGIVELVRTGTVTGLRVDHVDGLRDPDAYLERLRRLQEERDPSASPTLHLVVEKILAEEERLPESWPVSGSTGYDFLALLNGLFVEPAGLAALERAYRDLVGFHDPFPLLFYRKKRTIARDLFSGDVAELARLAARLVRSFPRGRDFTTAEVREALVEVTASLPVYRTYVREGPLRPEDRRWVEEALGDARRRAPHVSRILLHLLGSILTASGDAAGRADSLSFTRRWQQLTGAIMAKGMEDTIFYIYNALVSLNEVGGKPGSGATGVRHFHDFNLERLERWPGGLNATSTHDTKRGEDARTRISVLSELPAAWERKLRRWMEWNRGHRRHVDGREVPSANEEIMLYQTLLGGWPTGEEEVESFRDRLEGYLTKALREAKVHSSWRSPDEAYERALADFARHVLDPGADGPFLPDFRAFQEEVAFYGALGSLSQLLLKALAPGVVDIYQGAELWTLSLVDPDNRRPVDFETRARLLRELDEVENLFPHRLLAAWPDGRVKLFLTRALLRFRRRHRELFLHGEYRPIEGRGAHAERVVAALREKDGERVVGVAPRWFAGLVPPGTFPLGPEVWKDTHLELPPGLPARWTDVLTGSVVETADGDGGRRLRVGDVLTKLPVALLQATPQETGPG